MTEQDKNYIAITKNWIKSNELDESVIQLNIDHNKALIINLQNQVENDLERLNLQKEYSEKGISKFYDWCKLNNINPSEI